MLWVLEDKEAKVHLQVLADTFSIQLLSDQFLISYITNVSELPTIFRLLSKDFFILFC